MTTAAELRRLIEAGRGPTVDWHPESASASTLAASLVALANHQGGTVLVGVAPRGRAVTGVEDAAEVADRILQAALLAEPPLILPMPEVVQLNQARLVAASVPTGLPHVYALGGRYLTRDGTTIEPLSARRLRQLLIERGEVSYETDVLPGAGADDLDRRKVEEYLAGREGQGDAAPQDVLLQRGCLVKRGRTVAPTVAGLLLFGKEPQRWVKNADLTAARFAGREMGEKFVREDIGGTLPEQLRRAETFLLDHMRVGVQMAGMKREERPEYPPEAVREVIVNAVAHRDYSIKGDNVRLFLFSDRFEAVSPGKLAGPITVENIVKERFSRNAAIVQVLADMGYIERLGYGIDRMIALMREWGLRRPRFEETAGGFKVTLFGAGDVATDLSRWAGLGLNPRQERALAYLSGHRRITNREYQDLCPDVHAETIRRDLADLVERGLAIKVGDKRATYYILKEGKS